MLRPSEARRAVPSRCIVAAVVLTSGLVVGGCTSTAPVVVGSEDLAEAVAVLDLVNAAEVLGTGNEPTIRGEIVSGNKMKTNKVHLMLQNKPLTQQNKLVVREARPCSLIHFWAWCFL